MYNSEFCEVSYNSEYNVVFVKWKKFCKINEYRSPLLYALEIIKECNCNYVADTRNGFEDDPEDTIWIKNHFIPKAVEYGCKTIYFIIDKDNSLANELKGQEEDSKNKIKFEYIYNLADIRNYEKR